jgi:hypothetical protein
MEMGIKQMNDQVRERERGREKRKRETERINWGIWEFGNLVEIQQYKIIVIHNKSIAIV